MTTKDANNSPQQLGKASWKARKKNPKAIEHLRKISSMGGKNRWRKAV